MTDDPSSSSRQTTATSPTHSAPSLTERLFGWMKPAQAADLRTDLTAALESEHDEILAFSPEERAMIRNILRLQETRVADVMVPRADIIAVEQGTTLGSVLAKLRQSGHSRMPVFNGSLDQPVGMVHIKDVVSLLIDKAQSQPKRARAKARKAASAAAATPSAKPASKAVGNGPAQLVSVSELADGGFDLTKVALDETLVDAGIVRSLLFVPASMSVTDLMAQMQAKRVQMALVIDEYGGTDGLISLEDLIETVVGDIEDEHDDEEEPELTPLGDGGYLVDARIAIDDLQKVFGDRITVDEDDAEEIDTLGGLVFTAIGRIPVRGELIDAVDGLDIEVTEADPRRIKRLKIYPAGLRRRDPRAPRRAGRVAADDMGDGGPAEAESEVRRPAANDA